MQRLLFDNVTLHSDNQEQFKDEFLATILQKMITATTPVPNALVFATLFNQHKFRSSFFNALRNRAQRLPYNDWIYKYFVDLNRPRPDDDESSGRHSSIPPFDDDGNLPNYDN